MSDRSVAHSSQVQGRIGRKDRQSLGMIGVLLVVALVVALLIIQSGHIKTAENETVTAVPYGNAMEMQYAQPWLSRPQADTGPTVAYGNALEMLYAAPWLAKIQADTGPTVEYSNALEMLYAEPWLNAQQTTGSADD